MKKQTFFLVLLMVISAAAFPAQNWKAKFDASYSQARYDIDLKRSLDNNSDDYYDLAYNYDALLAMYRATGDKSYLDTLKLFTNNIIDGAKYSNDTNFKNSSYKDGYKGWVGNNGDELALDESFLWRYVCRFLRIIKETPSLYADPVYKAFYNKALSFTEEHIWEKWYYRGDNHEWVYRSRTHMMSHWGYIALDLHDLTVDHCIRKPIYRKVYREINNRLKANLQAAAGQSNAYFWNQTWDNIVTDPDDILRQDTSHGNNVIAYIVACYDNGEFWTKDDIIKFSNTLQHIIYNSGDIDFYDNVDGGYGDDLGKIYTGRFQSDGWVKLGKYSREIQDIYINALAQNFSIFKSYHLPQLYANLALNESEFDEIPREAEALPPSKPASPSPANSAAGVSVNVLLTWGYCTNTEAPHYKVYFGTSSNPPYKGTIDQLPGADRSYLPGLLKGQTKYYWRIDSIGKDGLITTGDVWSFTTGGPSVPHSPYPANNSKGVSADIDLTWGWCSNTISPYYRVYFGTGSNPPLLGTIDQLPGSGRSYDPGTLVAGKKYYWKIECLGADGAITTGPKWNFTVAAPSKPGTPYPAANATNVSRNVHLTWGYCSNTIYPHYKVYFGTSSNPPLKGDIYQLPGSGREYIPGTLQPNTTYYWRIEALGAGGGNTKGDVWKFTTGAN